MNGWYQIRDENNNVAMLKGLYDKNGEYTTNIWRTRSEAEEQLQLDSRTAVRGDVPMRETMQFQLSDTFSNHLIKYDDVRKKTIKQQPKKPK